MKKFVCTIVLFAGLIQLNAQNSLQNKVDSMRFPRLCKLNWYSPANFKQQYYSLYNIDIGPDTNNIALIGTLRIYDMVISSELGNKFQYLKDSLNPNMILFHNWNTTSTSLQEIGASLSFPMQSKWYSSLVGSTLKVAAYVNDTMITVQPGDGGKFLFTTNNGTLKWNDNIFIEDANPDSSEMILLDTVSANLLHIKTSAHYPNYDFSKIKHNHLQGSKVWIVHCPVWSSWWGYNISSVCPKIKIGNDSLKFNEYEARKIAKDYNNQQSLIDGIWLDTYNDYYIGPYCDFGNLVNPYVDMDLNGIPDLNEGHDINWINQKWIDGHTELTMHLRNLIGQDIPIVLNNGGTYSIQYVNGVHYERLPALVWDTTMGSNPSLKSQWEAALQQYTSQMTCDTISSCPSPRICQIMGWQDGILSYDYKKMRKSLTFTLMNDGFYYYSDWSTSGRTFWWFDEYSVDSTGSSVTLANGNPVDRVDPTQMNDTIYLKLKKAKGYLGFPLGKYQKLSGGVLRRDFEHGVAFCNTSSDNVEVFLSLLDTLKRIKGKQDVVVNNGESVIGSFVLPKNDGIILLRKNKLTGIEPERNLPTRFMLYQNYPNPFNPSTTISFSIPKHEHVTLKVFNILGREVTTLVNDELNPGEHSISFSAKDLASGIYFYRLTTSTFSETKPMVVIK